MMHRMNLRWILAALLATLASAAWVFGLGEANVALLVREAALALVAVELWRLDDGAFPAIGFQLAFRFLEASFGGFELLADDRRFRVYRAIKR